MEDALREPGLQLPAELHVVRVLDRPDPVPELAQPPVPGRRLPGRHLLRTRDPVAGLIDHGRDEGRRLGTRESVEQLLADRFRHEDVALAVDPRERRASRQQLEVADVAELLEHTEHAVELPRECLGSRAYAALDAADLILQPARPQAPSLVLLPLRTGVTGMLARFLLQGCGTRLVFGVRGTSLHRARWADVESDQTAGEVPAEPGAPGGSAPRKVDLRDRVRRVAEEVGLQAERLAVLREHGRLAVGVVQHHGQPSPPRRRHEDDVARSELHEGATDLVQPRALVTALRAFANVAGSFAQVPVLLEVAEVTLHLLAIAGEVGLVAFELPLLRDHAAIRQELREG